MLPTSNLSEMHVRNKQNLSNYTTGDHDQEAAEQRFKIKFSVLHGLHNYDTQNLLIAANIHENLVLCDSTDYVPPKI
jgi:hypothetical protein